MKTGAYYWSIFLFKKCFFTSQIQLKYSTAKSYSYRRPAREFHSTWICSYKLPPGLACLWKQNFSHWSWDRHWRRQGRDGRISGFLFPCASLTPLLIYLIQNPTYPPSDDTLILHISSYYLSTFSVLLRFTRLIFLFCVPQTELTSQLYPMHSYFQKSSIFFQGVGGRSKKGSVKDSAVSVCIFRSSTVTKNVKTGKLLNLVTPG